MTCGLSFGSAEGSEVEFFAVVYYEEGGVLELLFLAAIEELLEEACWAFEEFYDVAAFF